MLRLWFPHSVSSTRPSPRSRPKAFLEVGVTREEIQRASKIASIAPEAKEAARDAGLDDNQSALLKAAKAPTPEAQVAVLRGIRERGRVAEDGPPPPKPDDYHHEPPEAPPLPISSGAIDRPPPAGAKPLRNLENIDAGSFARWVKLTTPNDRPHVIAVLERAAAILRKELEGRDFA